MKKVNLIIVSAVLMLVVLTGCMQRESDKVSYNLSKEADNFNVVRRLTVTNCITGDNIFQMVGKLSIEADTADNQLEIIVERDDGTYQKHFVGISDNTTYLVEDLGSNNVSKYKYTLNYNPKMWLPVDVKTID